MQISEIRDPSLFQRLVRKLMIAEHDIDYQVVDDSGGDGGLDGFNRSTGDLDALYCPEKPASARYRRKFESDLAKTCQLRDTKDYPIKRFVFITPEPLREPDQRILRDLARDLGFKDGINVSGEYLDVLLSRHMEILPQFPELSYPQIEQKLDRVLSAVEELQQRQGSPSEPEPTHKISGAAAQILTLAVKAANETIEGAAESEVIVRLLDLKSKEYGEAVEELDALGLIVSFPSINHPGGCVRVRVRAHAFVQVAAQVLPEVDVSKEIRNLLETFNTNSGEYVLATDILQKSSVPLARAQILIDYLVDQQLVETSMYGQPDSLSFYYGRILPRGKRILQGKDTIPL